MFSWVRGRFKLYSDSQKAFARINVRLPKTPASLSWILAIFYDILDWTLGWTSFLHCLVLLPSYSSHPRKSHCDGCISQHLGDSTACEVPVALHSLLNQSQFLWAPHPTRLTSFCEAIRAHKNGTAGIKMKILFSLLHNDILEITRWFFNLLSSYPSCVTEGDSSSFPLMPTDNFDCEKVWKNPSILLTWTFAIFMVVLEIFLHLCTEQPSKSLELLPRISNTVFRDWLERKRYICLDC